MKTVSVSRVQLVRLSMALQQKQDELKDVELMGAQEVEDFRDWVHELTE